MIGYYKCYYRLASKEKALFAEAVFFLLLAKLMLLVLPFRICIRTIPPHAYEEHPADEILQSVKQAVYRANRLSCWKNVCLVQAFAARWMLQRRKIASTFSIGVKHEPGRKVTAHAWLMAGNRDIVSEPRDYLVIQSF
jgi:hypothetical protein